MRRQWPNILAQSPLFPFEPLHITTSIGSHGLNHLCQNIAKRESAESTSEAPQWFEQYVNEQRGQMSELMELQKKKTTEVASEQNDSLICYCFNEERLGTYYHVLLVA